MSQMGAFYAAGKVVGTGAIGNAYQGVSVKLSEDGIFMFAGGSADDNEIGAVWFHQKISGVWTQKQKIVPTGFSGTPSFGWSLAVNPSMTTMIVGARYDNGNIGASFVFTFDGTSWAQQGGKLVGNGMTGTTGSCQGCAVALSTDGNTAITGGPYDGSYVGAAWIFVRSGNTWSQQGSKLVGTSYSGTSYQGLSVALTSDGNLAVVGGSRDNSDQGAIWVYLRSGSSWNQVGSKIAATGETGAGNFGNSLALSGDDQTLVCGGYGDNSNVGAAWILKRNGNTFTQFGSKLVGTGATSSSQQGFSVAVNKVGTMVAVGARGDSSNAGAVFVYYFDGTQYNQLGSKIVATTAIGSAYQGQSVSLDGLGSQLLFGGFNDNGQVGAAWIYVYVATSQPSIGPTAQPSRGPTTPPSVVPTTRPSLQPTTQPSLQPTTPPSLVPSTQPSVGPTSQPVFGPTTQPSVGPTTQPSVGPTTQPSLAPTTQPSVGPTTPPSSEPSVFPTAQPSVVPTAKPSYQPSIKPSLAPIALTSASTASSLNTSSIIIIGVIGGLALLCTMLLIRYRLTRTDTTVGEMKEWIEDSKANKNHGGNIQLKPVPSKPDNEEGPLMTDIYEVI